FEQNLEVYYDQVTVRLPLSAGAAGPLTLTVTSQGCADAGLCYPPMSKDIVLQSTAGGYEPQGPMAKSSVPAPLSQAELGLSSRDKSGGAVSNAPSLGDVLTMG